MPDDIEVPPNFVNAAAGQLQRFNWDAGVGLRYDRALEAYVLPAKEPNKTPLMQRRIDEIYPLRSPSTVNLKVFASWAEATKTDTDPRYQFKDPKGLYGIEVEVENVVHIDHNIPLVFWRIEEDGSLRNNGKEFKTHAIPATMIEAALTQLYSGLNKDVSFSKRTSIHVHQDVRAMTASQVLGILFLYLVLENTMFKYAGLTRRNNIYTVPLQETDLPYNFSKTPEAVFTGLGHVWSKYSALNLLPLSSFGTLEYRHMPGHNNIPKTLVWIDMIGRLKIYSYRNPLESIVEQINALNTNSQYELFVRQVFGELAGYLDLSDLKSDMERAVTMVKNSAISNLYHLGIVAGGVEKGSKLYEAMMAAKPQEAVEVTVHDEFWPDNWEDELSSGDWWDQLHTIQKYAVKYIKGVGGYSTREVMRLAMEARRQWLEAGAPMFFHSNIERTEPVLQTYWAVLRTTPTIFRENDTPRRYFGDEYNAALGENL